MVKIIKNTMTNPVKIQCEYCKSELEYFFEDIKRKEVPGLFYGNYLVRYVICPVCKHDIKLHEEYMSKSEAADD